MFSLKDITTITLTLFAIIHIIGGLPVIISIKNNQKYLDSGKATPHCWRINDSIFTGWRKF